METQHLIIGSGVLGLSLADQLLRRGAESVTLVDCESAPSRRGHGDRAAVLRTQDGPWAEIEDLGLEVLEDWQAALEVDPDFRRCGSLTVSDSGDALAGPPVSTPTAGERATHEELTDSQARERQHLLHVPDGGRARFCGTDGSLDTTQLLSALHWQVRRRGGRPLFDCVLDSLFVHPQGGYGFRAGSRAGRTEHVYFTGEPWERRLLGELEIARATPWITWHRFQLRYESPGGAMVHLRWNLDSGTESTGIPLEGLEGLETEAPEQRRTVLLDLGDGEVVLLLEGERTTSDSDPPVDWSVLEQFRRGAGPWLPDLVEAPVRRGHAENLLDLETEHPFESHHEGKVWVGGAFGPHGALLALGSARRIAQEAIPRPTSNS